MRRVTFWELTYCMEDSTYSLCLITEMVTRSALLAIFDPLRELRH